MNKSYTRINWENYPSDETPINETNLNKMDAALDLVDDRVLSIDTSKADKLEVSSLVSEVEYDESTGTFTVIKKNGSKFTIDTKLEKLAVNFIYDVASEQIIITLDDGTRQYIDVSALITQYEFLDTGTITFTIGNDGKVSANVKEGSISEKHLNPNYLADIKVEVAKVQASQKAVSSSEANVKQCLQAASDKADEAERHSQTASDKADIAVEKAADAQASAKASASSAKAGAISEANAAESAQSASLHAVDAATRAGEAAKSAANAESSADKAKLCESITNTYAQAARSYAVGDTAYRDNENTDNAKYYYQQAKQITSGLAGALLPMGTITFAELSTQTKQPGYMYNISDDFISNDMFKDGGNIKYQAGTNVYYTADGYWDCLAGAMSKYALLSDLKTIAFSGSYSDLNNVPGTFPPSSHTHTKAQISDFPSSLPANGGNSSTVNGHTVNSDVPSNAKFTDTNTWRPLGTTGDTACAGNDSRLSNARPASDVYSWAKQSTKPSYSWSEISNKPGTFTPSSHTHADYDNAISDLRKRFSGGSLSASWDSTSLRLMNYIGGNMIGYTVFSRSDTDFAIVDTIRMFRTSNNVLFSGERGSYMVAVSAFSDARIKRNVKVSKVNALDRIDAIKMYEYDFTDSKYGEHSELGYIAQQLKKVIPECVVSVPQNEEQMGYDELYQVQDVHLIPYLVKAVQELSSKVDELEKQIGERG